MEIADSFAIFTDTPAEAVEQDTPVQPDVTPEPEDVEEEIGESPEVEQSDEESTAEVNEETSPPSSDVLSQLREYGIISDDVTVEDLPDAIALRIENEVTNQVDGILSDLKERHGEEASDLVKYLMNGGSVDDYLKLYGEKPLSQFDINSEIGQDQFLRYALAKEGKTPEEIDDLMEYYQERDLVEKNATKAYSRVKAEQDAHRRDQLNKIAEQQAEQKRQAREVRDQVKKGILSVESVGGYKVTPTQRQIIAQYMTQPTAKTESGAMTSRFIADMQKIVAEQPDNSFLIADMVRSLASSGKFNESMLSKYLQTAATKEVKRNINKKSSPRTDDPFAEWM